MRIYFFNLKTPNGNIRDPEGMELADESAVRDLARQVAREPMKWREPQTHSWRIAVREGEGRQCFGLLSPVWTIQSRHWGSSCAVSSKTCIASTRL
jgi:hypothetical protein